MSRPWWEREPTSSFGAMHALLAALLLVLPAFAGDRLELSAPAGAREPQLSVDASGTVVVTYGVKDALHVQVSKDRGASFGAPIRIGEKGKLALGMRRGPRVAVHGSTITLTAICGQELAGKDGDVYAWSSDDLGATWKEPVRVNAVAGSAREGLQTLACGDDGGLLCAWIDLRGEKPVVMASKSTDGGRAWSDNTNLMRAGNELCPCCCPTATFGPNGVVYVMWRGVEDGARDPWFTSGSMASKTFLAPRRLATERWKTDQCPMDLGSLLVTGLDQTAIVRRAGKVVSVGGPNLAAAKEETLVGDGQQVWAARGARHEYVVFSERPGGPLVLVSTEAPRRVLAEKARAAVIGAPPLGADPVIAAWEEGPVETPRIVLARVDGAAEKR